MPTSLQPVSGESPTSYLDRLRKMLEGIQVFVAVFVLTKILSADQRRRLTSRWGSHIPALALALADVLDFETTAFVRLGYTGKELRDDNEEIRILTNLKTITDDMSAKISSRLAEAKASLADRVLNAVNEVNSLMDSKLTDPALVGRLNVVVLPMNKIVDDFNAKKQYTRDSNDQIRAEGAAEVADVTDELRRKQIEILVKDGKEIPASALIDAAGTSAADPKAAKSSSRKAGKPAKASKSGKSPRRQAKR